MIFEADPNALQAIRHRSRPKLADYINRFAYGERFILMRGKKPVAELSPVPTGRSLRELPDLLASLPRLSEEEAAGFEEDIAAMRADLSRLPVRDPWES